jgi:hypothetical protein
MRVTNAPASTSFCEPPRRGEGDTLFRYVSIMEAASRPPLEPLADLPVEEPLDAAAAPKGPQAAAAAPVAAQAAPAAPAAGTTSKSPEQTGLNFVDPEMFLATGVLPTAVAVTPAAKEPDPPLALELEDPVVDEILTAPPPPAPPPPATEPSKSPLSLTPDSPAAAKSAPATEERSTRVPIAKTASLSAAATKLAAASSQRTVSKSSKPAAPAPEAPVARPAAKEIPTKPAPAKPVPPKELSVREMPARDLAAKEVVAKEGAAKEIPASPAKPAAANGKLDAPSLASWASARAAATPSSKPAAPAAKPATAAAAAPAPAPAVRTVPKPAAPAPAAAPTAAAAAAASAPMDRDFIARNQVVERYLSGRLPLKGATDFERFCHDHPQMLDEIGLPERVNAGLRLLEAAGKPEPWQEAPRPAWQKPTVTLGLAAAVAVLAIAFAGVTGHSASKSHHIADLEKRVAEQPLDPATSTRSIRLMPSRSGASNAPAIIIGGGKAELADIKIDESRSPYHVFRITIDRIDQGRVGVIANIAKDSNGHLRIALNSSALGPGNYQLTLEGIDWRGEPQPDSWVTIGVAR